MWDVGTGTLSQKMAVGVASGENSSGYSFGVSWKVGKWKAEGGKKKAKNWKDGIE